MVSKLAATLRSARANFKSDAFYRHALMFMAASLITSVLNYIYYPIMGRMIGVEGYGELQVLTSFLLQLTTVFIGLNLISVNIVANHDERESKALIIALQKVVFWFVALACVGVLLVSPQLKHFFHFSSSWPFVLLIPSLLVDAIAVFWTAYLQAKRDFTSLSFYTILTGGGKIVFSVLFVKLGLGVAGGILGIAAGLWLSLIAVRLITKHELPPLLQTLAWPKRHEINLIKRHVTFIVEVIVALIGMSVLLSIDVMLVKHLFSAEYAGQYSGVSTVARIIFYASAPLVSVMLPAITLRSLKASKQAFYRTLGLSMTICVAGLLVFTLLSHFIMRVLLGEQFAAASSWLPLLSVVALLVTVTNIMVNYLLALRSHLALVISLTSLALATILIFLHHDTINQIVASASIGLLAGQAIFWVATFVTRGNLVRGETGEGVQ
jgi:O-antigen/teichoic acid export membrane protein